MARRQTGTAVMVLLIDESGKVADCTLTETSGAAALDAQGCAVIRERGKFTPAIGTDGRPAKSAIQVRVHWKL
jgi:protein TonB